MGEYNIDALLQRGFVYFGQPDAVSIYSWSIDHEADPGVASA